MSTSQATVRTYHATHRALESEVRSPIETDRDAALGYAEFRVRETVRDFVEIARSKPGARAVLASIVEEECR